MTTNTVKDLIEDCTLEDLACDPALLKQFAALIHSIKELKLDPVCVQEIKNSRGVSCLEITSVRAARK